MNNYYKSSWMLLFFSFLTGCSMQGEGKYNCLGEEQKLHGPLINNPTDLRVFLEDHKAVLDQEGEATININAQCAKDKTMLMKAANMGQLEVVKILLKCKNIDVNLASEADGSTALMYAFIGGTARKKKDKEEIAALLVENKASLTAQNKAGETAPMHAIVNNYFPFVENLLQEKKIDVNAQTQAENPSPTVAAGTTLLMRAAKTAKLHAVEGLLHHGANADLQDTNGKTALMHVIDHPAMREAGTEDKKDIIALSSLLIVSMNKERRLEALAYAKRKTPSGIAGNMQTKIMRGKKKRTQLEIVISMLTEKTNRNCG